MPEIAEVARAVNRLRTYLVGKTISEVITVPDELVFHETTHQLFKAAMEGKKVMEAKQWGKYFWYGIVL
jgi:formamidopyrimidine-DNA glycosylase